MARTEECILYRNFDNGEVLDIMTSLMNSYEAGEKALRIGKRNFSIWQEAWWKWQECMGFPGICGTLI